MVVVVGAILKAGGRLVSPFRGCSGIDGGFALQECSKLQLERTR